LTIYDPRLTFPKKRLNKNILEESSDESTIFNYSSSNIWNLDKLLEIKNSKLSERVLNERKAKNLIPGTPLTPENQDSRLPILILGRSGAIDSKIGSGKSCDTLSSGLDVIMHRAWARECWRAFIYAGAKAGGLKERKSSYFEDAIPSFPYDYPETKAYQEIASMIEIEEREAYGRRPKNKKLNFEKVGIKSPFSIPFDFLTNGMPVIMLDQPLILEELNTFIHMDSFMLLESPCASFFERISQTFPAISKYLKLDDLDSYMVRIRLLTLRKGSPQDRAIIYESAQDRYKFWTEKTDDEHSDESNHPLLVLIFEIFNQ
jgi:ribonuclease P/MRP protein subunit POP1